MKTEVEDEGLFVDGFLSAVEAIKPERRIGARRSHERKAGRTQKQRSRRSDKTEQINFRGSVETKQLVETAAKVLGCKRVEVLEMAMAALAEKHGL